MSDLARGARPAMAVAVLVLTALAAVAPASAAGSGAEPPAPVLERDMRGEQAIRALGDRLPAVAARNDLSPAEFRAALREDEMLWVGTTGQLLFVDEFGHDHADASEPVLGPDYVPTATEVFGLHSRPGADRVIVLDFDGHDYKGTAWSKGGRSAYASPYTQDADGTTFNEAERAAIHSVWQRVAEDYAPFAVDVTTENVSADRIRRDDVTDPTYGTRVVITPTQAYNCSCGGVAYVGVFDAIGDTHDYYQPAWVFTSGVGTGAKNIAEATSHEAGHNLGLSHDGTSSTGYYTGHGTWAPIMGVGYYRAISQWSRGEYAGANNAEDDFDVVHTNGAPAATDDHSDVPAAATVLGTTPVAGVIESATDLDVFSISSTQAGLATFSVAPSAVSPNLDVHLRLLDQYGTTIAFDDPASSASVDPDGGAGLGAQIVFEVGVGSYFLVVDGVGFGSPSTTGYSDYGSLGRYTISAALDGGGTVDPPPPPDDDPAEPPSAPTGISATTSGQTVTVSWTDTSDDETGFEVVREQLHKNGTWRGTTVVVVGPDTTERSEDPGTGTFRYRVRAINGAGASTYTLWAEATIAGGGGGKPPKSR